MISNFMNENEWYVICMWNVSIKCFVCYFKNIIKTIFYTEFLTEKNIFTSVKICKTTFLIENVVCFFMNQNKWNIICEKNDGNE